MSDWINVLPAGDFPEGEYQSLEVDGVMIAVFNVGGEFYALEDVCTHDQAELTGGKVEGDCVACPRHGAKFSIKTGEALTPPAYEAITTFPTRVTEDGMVQVRDHRWD